MWTIADDMIEEASRQGRLVTVLADAQAIGIRQLASERFAKTTLNWPLWESMDGPSVQEERAWRNISSFVDGASCVIFWEPRTEKKVLRFCSGGDLVAVLEECHRSEFYVTNDEVSYLLCFNGHDYLIGQGLAAGWVTQYLEASALLEPSLRDDCSSS